MKKIIIILSIVIVNSFIYAQENQKYRQVSDIGIDEIIIGHKVHKKQLSKYNGYTKTTKFHHLREKPHFTKEYYIENGLEVFLQKRKRCGFTYIVNYIIIRHPFNAITEKGIQIGKSNKNDVLEKYGIPMEANNDYIAYNTTPKIRMFFYFDKDSANTISSIIIRAL